jgi:hypothetical protein
MNRGGTHKRLGYTVLEDKVFRNQRHDIKKCSKIVSEEGGKVSVMAQGKPLLPLSYMHQYCDIYTCC